VTVGLGDEGSGVGQGAECAGLGFFVHGCRA
jgi:hypothetical protein